MGQELGKLDLAKGRPEKMSQDATFNPKLSELGVTRSESSRWQAVARIPEPAFESFITSTKEITTAGALKLAGAARRGTSARAVPTGGRQAESANTAGHGRRPIDVLWSAWNACLEQEQREFLTSIGVDESDDDDDEDDSDNDGEPADGIYEIEFNSGDIVGLRPGMIGRAPSPQSKTPAT
jgi:hypothetical protein